MARPGIPGDGIWSKQGRSRKAREKRERKGTDVNENLFLLGTMF